MKYFSFLLSLLFLIMLSQKVSADAIEHSTQVTISQDTLNSSNQFEHSLNLCKMKYMIQYDMENGKTLNMLIDEAKRQVCSMSVERGLYRIISIFIRRQSMNISMYTGLEGLSFPSFLIMPNRSMMRM